MQTTNTYEALAAISYDALAEKVGGKFKLTRLIAQRLKDIHHGAPPLVETHPKEAMLAVVCREIEQGLINLELHLPDHLDYGEQTSFESDDYLGIQESGEE